MFILHQTDNCLYKISTELLIMLHIVECILFCFVLFFIRGRESENGRVNWLLVLGCSFVRPLTHLYATRQSYTHITLAQNTQIDYKSKNWIENCFWWVCVFARWRLQWNCAVRATHACDFLNEIGTNTRTRTHTKTKFIHCLFLPRSLWVEMGICIYGIWWYTYLLFVHSFVLEKWKKKYFKYSKRRRRRRRGRQNK